MQFQGFVCTVAYTCNSFQNSRIQRNSGMTSAISHPLLIPPDPRDHSLLLRHFIYSREQRTKQPYLYGHLATAAKARSSVACSGGLDYSAWTRYYFAWTMNKTVFLISR